MEYLDTTFRAITWAKARSLRILCSHVFRCGLLGILFAWLLPTCFAGQIVEQVGPYVAHLVEGGPSLKKALPESIANAHRWSEWVWFHADNSNSDSLIAGAGDPDSSHSRYIEVLNGRPVCGSRRSLRCSRRPCCAQVHGT